MTDPNRPAPARHGRGREEEDEGMKPMMKYLGHDGEWVSDGDCDDYDLYPHLKSDLGGGPCDELDRAEEMRERGRRVMAGLRAKADTPLITICAWCKKRKDEAGTWCESLASDTHSWQVSHGMCPDCYDKNFEEIKGGTE